MILKNKIIHIMFFAVSLFAGNMASSQVLSNGSLTQQYNSANVFLDAATSYDPTFSFDNNNGKGLLFSRTDLTKWVFDVAVLDGILIPTAYDGMIVYNVGTGNTPTTGNNPTTSTDVTPGFYYFSNTSVDPNFFNPTITQGEWKPLGSAGSPKIHITENTPTETNLVTANTATEKVISITGTADGITTHIDLGTTVLPKDTVINFRKAIICDNTGNQVLVATGSYDSATNKFVTGNGMMNYLLPAANDYKVELYFTSN